MRKIVLVAALLLASASAHAGDRSLSLSGMAGQSAAPQAAPIATPASQVSEVAPVAGAPKYSDRPPAVSLPPVPAAAAAPAATPITTASAPVATTRPAKAARAEKPKRKREWTERRIISELHRHGIYW